jgi:hypothetical protein
MLNSNTQQRELVYLVYVDAIEPIPGKDRVEAAVIGGWRTMVKKDAFKPGDIGIYFEIDSKTPETPPFDFLEKYHYKIKTQKFKSFYSQGLLMHPSDFGWTFVTDIIPYGVIDNKGNIHHVEDESRFLTEQLGITYAVAEDNKRKAKVNPDAKINAALGRHPKISKKYGKIIKRNKLLRWFFTLIWGKKKDSETSFPTKFPYVHKTDQERAENMTWVLEDKTPYVVTQKCDGSSGTYILERKPFGKFEFYVCSRNVRQLTPNQKSYYDDNHYWNVAFKYDLENKMKDYMKKHPDISYLCWQGEVCAPQIQKNPQGLTEEHLFLFHCTDSNGRWAMLDAVKMWKEYGLETVPVVDGNYILPDDFEEFKLSADGYYDPSVCEGKTKQKREGFVYYKTTDPNFSFKNVSREYLTKRGE